MVNDAKYMEVFMSRIMPCEKCRLRESPKKGQRFILFGGTSQKYRVEVVESNLPIKRHGLTPHFVQAFGLNKAGDGVVVISNCCMEGCEVDIEWNSKSGIYDIDFKIVNAITLPIKDWEALVQRWHGSTGYEL